MSVQVEGPLDTIIEYETQDTIQQAIWENIHNKRFHLAEDLTSDSFNCLMELRAHSKVLRAWSVAGELRFTLKNGDSSHVHKVKSIYDNVDRMLSHM